MVFGSWWNRQGLFGLGLCLLLLGSFNCTQDQNGPKSCSFDHQCEDNERCVYNKSECAVHFGEGCEGTCTPEEVPPDVACACKKDEDCNYPLEGCGNCQCYDRGLQECKTAKDCGQGFECLGNGKVSVCEARRSCQEDKDCQPTHACREKRCCNPTAGNCPGDNCQVGQFCAKDAECAPCGLKCKDGRCELEQVQPKCLGSICVRNLDCQECNAVCEQGRCRVTGTNCPSARCVVASDCGPAFTTCTPQGCCQ